MWPRLRLVLNARACAPIRFNSRSGVALDRPAADSNVARQITYRADVPEAVPAFTVNQACGSGLQAIMLAAQQIMLGRADIVLAGGTESMSRVPYFAEGARWGMRMGNTELVDGMYRDGFNDPLSGLVMGETARKPRASVRDFASRARRVCASFAATRAQAAIDSGRFDEEIGSLKSKAARVKRLNFARDEHARAGTTEAGPRQAGAGVFQSRDRYGRKLVRNNRRSRGGTCTERSCTGKIGCPG